VGAARQVRPSPRLAQAGLIALGGSSGAASPDSPEAAATAAPPEVSAEVSEEVTAREGDGLWSEAAPAAEKEESTHDWLEHILGPASSSWPGRPTAVRSKVEQQERLARLAKPREKKEEAAAVVAEAPARPRSPRSQREACSRLAVPKQQRSKEAKEAVASEEAMGDAWGAPPPMRGAGMEEEASCVGVESDREGAGVVDVEAENAAWAAAAEARLVAVEGGQPVKVIPSLLNQLNGRLERIEEDRPAQAAPMRSRRRARSLGAAAAGVSAQESIGGSASSSAAASPYAAPVPSAPLPRPAVAVGTAASGVTPGPRRGGVAQLRAKSGEGRGRAACCGAGGEEVEDGEEMLMDIDRLYNELLTGGAGAECGEARASSQPPSRAAVQRGIDPEWRPLGKDDGPSSLERLPPEKQSHADGFGFDDLCASSSVPAAPEPLVRRDGSRGALQPLLRPSVDGPPGVSGDARGEWLVDEEDGEEGNELLANIDRLYGEMVSGGRSARSARSADGPSDGLPVPVGAAVSLGPPIAAVGAEALSPADAAPATALGELQELLEEVLWSALLLGRSAGSRIDVQSRLLELLPPHILAACFQACGTSGLPASLLQRIGTELPLVSAALLRRPRGAARAARGGAVAMLAGTLRQARDSVLALASSSDLDAEDVALRPSSAARASESSSQPQQAKAKRPPKPPRKTSLSHWTADSLNSLEAPASRVVAKHMAPK